MSPELKLPAHITPEDRAECLRTDSLWVLQWYPNTPIGFYRVAGPTLERVLELANAPVAYNVER
jgi:hypothetical protein